MININSSTESVLAIQSLGYEIDLCEPAFANWSAASLPGIPLWPGTWVCKGEGL